MVTYKVRIRIGLQVLYLEVVSAKNINDAIKKAINNIENKNKISFTNMRGEAININVCSILKFSNN